MREKKYAEIAKSSKKKEKVDSIEKEEKLSMTREMKFKELQEKMDIEDNSIDVHLEEENKLEEKLEKENKPKRGRPKKKVEVTNKELGLKKPKVEDLLDETKEIKKTTDIDDLYLTTSFKPLRNRFKVSKLIKVLFTLICIIGMLSAFIYFIAIPVYKMIVDGQPKAIYDSSIDYIVNTLNTNLDDMSDNFDDDYLEYKFGITSNMEELKAINNKKIGFGVGIDRNTKLGYATLFTEKDNERYGLDILQKDNDEYIHFTGSEKYLLTEEVSQDDIFTSVVDMFDELSSIKTDDYKYIVTTNGNILKELITEEMLKSKFEEIKINNQELKVVRNTLEFDKDSMSEFLKRFSEKTLEDDKLIKLYAELFEVSNNDIKDVFKDIVEVEDNYSLTINIYSYKGNQIVGFDVEENGFVVMSYYNLDGNFNIHINLTEDECDENEDCVLGENVIIDLIGTKQEDYTKVEINYNDEEIATLKVREFSLKKMDLDYRIIFNDLVIDGDFYYEKKEMIEKLDLMLEFGGEFIRISVESNNDDSLIPEIPTNNIVNYSDNLFSQEYEYFLERLEEHELDGSFDLWYELFTMDFDSYLSDENQNSNDSLESFA